MRKRSALLAAAAALSANALSAVPALADLLPRTGAAAGAVIARRSGEEARFIEVGDWRTVDIRQDLLPGDVLRTNAAGNLAILFSDRTQVRLGRNSTLVVRKIGGDGADTELALESGQLWARAERGGEGVAVATPAATAAIRGTDWSMSVDGSGTTSLTVLEGQVELANAEGAVTLNQGEAASAAIGRAPTKIVIVRPKDRAQMLLTLSVRGAFDFFPASPLPITRMRAEIARIAAIPPGARGAEDRVTLAETRLSFEGREAAAAAVAAAREVALSPSQQARLAVVEGLLAGGRKRYAEASALFARAAPRLDPRRRAIALYGGFYARALADPDRRENPPATPGGGPYAAVAEAYTAGALDDIPRAIAILREAEKRFPDDPALPAMRGQFAFFLDDRPQAEEAFARSLALDPDNSVALAGRSNYRAGVQGDFSGALADLQRAAAIAPGFSTIWNDLGTLQAARGADREAEAAFKQAIMLEPEDPAAHANLALLYLDQSRTAEAKAEIDRALAEDPAFDVMLIARGRYRLETGDLEGGIEDLLAGTTANPAYAQGLLLLGAGQYEAGDREASRQAFDNADRLDPNDPITPNQEATIAIADYDADRAVANAREALRRSRLRGGELGSLRASKQDGSTLNDAYRFQGLDAWGRYYGDAVFDPFSLSSLLDQAKAGSANPFVNDLDFGGTTAEPTLNDGYFGSLFQSILRNPTRLVGRTRTADILHRPFFEASLGGGFVASEGGDGGWLTSLDAQGYTDAPIPVGFLLNFDSRRSDDAREGSYTVDPITNDVRFTLGDDDLSGTGYIAAQPTPHDAVLAYVDVRRDVDNLTDARFDFTPPVFGTIPEFPLITLGGASYDREVEDRSLTSGLAVSHSFGYHNTLDAGLFASGFERSSSESGTFDFDLAGRPLDAIGSIDGEFDSHSLLGAVSHLVEAGGVTFRYGGTFGHLDQQKSERSVRTLVVAPDNPDIAEQDTRLGLDAGRAYVEALYDITPTLRAEGGLFGTYLASTEMTLNDAELPEFSEKRLEPRLGLAWEPLPGQAIRIGFLRESGAFSGDLLAPVGVVGLQSNQLPLGITGFADTLAARWDAEWTPSFFTSLDYQHQDFEGLEIPIPGGITTADIGEGRIDRVSGTANLDLPRGFGVFATLAYTDSESQAEGFGKGDPLPYVPELSGRAGFTYVSPANLKLTVAETYVGERAGELGGDDLAPYWTTDAFLTWEPLDKRFSVELAGYNLFGTDFDVAAATPGWSRTFTGSLKVRF